MQSVQAGIDDCLATAAPPILPAIATHSLNPSLSKSYLTAAIAKISGAALSIAGSFEAYDFLIST